MKKTFSMQIVNEYVLDADTDLRVFEIKNDAEQYPTYDYYLWMPHFAMVETFGVLQDAERFTEESLKDLYENGYFDTDLTYFA